MYELPKKGDLDRKLSEILHEFRKKAKAEGARVTSECAAHGALNSSRRIVLMVSIVDALQTEMLARAASTICELEGLGSVLNQVAGRELC